MKNLTTAIYGQMAGSAFGTAIGSRLFKGQAQEDTAYPYCTYQVVTNNPEHGFSEDYENTTIQFSLFSTASGTTEIETMFTNLKTLYDEQSFSITGSTLIWMRRATTVFNVEDHITPNGTQRVWAYHVDFEIMTSLD